MQPYRPINIRLFVVCLLLVLITATSKVSAQYYDWGQDPASIKWLQIKSKNGRFVFPDYYSRQAVRLMHYMDKVQPEINYGFKHPTMRMPLFMHTQNFQSNALVMLAPKRMEFITPPTSAIAAMPWLKQLAVHEYRHNVQFSNMNQNVIKVLSYVLGEHGSLIGAAFFPYWAMEGDAVLTETQFSSVGRGLQPSFTIAYRALALEGENGKYPIDKYFCGSFRDHLPDHYHLGYQLTSWAYTTHGSDYWSRVVEYGTRRPYQLFTAKVAQRKFFDSSTDKLFKGAFNDLNEYWRSLPMVDNSSQIIETPITSYTTYSSPIELDDGSIVALKSDFDHTSRIVIIERESGRETVIHRTGVINTPLSYYNGRLWWSELRRSAFWEQRVNSQICWYDLTTSKAGREKSESRAMFPVGMPNGGYAAIEYDYTGYYSIKHTSLFHGTTWSLTMPDTLSLHGLAWDDNTRKLYFIALSDSGMWIGATTEGSDSYSVVTKPNYSTISDLRASAGVLYFSSIASGKDEAHCYDIAQASERQLTESRYGSFSPTPTADGKGYIVTTYTPDGYLIAEQKQTDSPKQIVEWSKLPKNIVNPKRVKWDVTNIDNYTPADTTSLQIKRYRKGLNLFNFHSWMPAHFEPDKILSENRFNINLGVTLLSQNLLNNTFATVGYKYTEGGHSLTTMLRYYGLAPKFEIEAEYGTADQLFYRFSPINISPDDNPKLNNAFSLNARVFLPISLSSGYRQRWLTPMIEFEHENAKIHSPNYIGFIAVPKYHNGVQKLSFSLQYSDYTRLAYRDFLPKWGYSLRVRNTSNPWDSKFSKLWSGYGRTYLPGIMKHHSLMLRGALQCSEMEYYNFRQKELFPRGADYRITPKRYWSLAGDYQFPVWYPDGGISSVLYFKRIRANLFYDFARYRSQYGGWRNITSYGVDITLDIVPLRLPSNTNTSLTISIQKPSTRRGVVFAFTFGMPI